MPRPRCMEYCSLVERDDAFGQYSTDVYRLCAMYSRHTPRGEGDVAAATQLTMAPSMIQVPPPPPKGLTSQELEAAQRRREADKLMASLPAIMEQRMLGFRDAEWCLVPPSKRRELRHKHVCSFSHGQLATTRRALARLQHWIQHNALETACGDFDVSGGVMAWFVTDAQATSRSSGESVPQSLRSALVFASKHLHLPLDVNHDAFVTVAAPSGKRARPALAATVPVLYHMLELVRHVRLGGCVLLCYRLPALHPILVASEGRTAGQRAVWG